MGFDILVAFVSMREDVSLFHKYMDQHPFHITSTCKKLMVSFQKRVVIKKL